MDYLIPYIDSKVLEIEGHLKDGNIIVSFIDRPGAQEITIQHAQQLASCYIDLGFLVKLAKMNETTVGEQLEELLPDKNHIRSGDFGEILCRSILQQTRSKSSFPVYRWRNRSTKNDTVRGTDLVGYSKQEIEDSIDDVLFLCEVKTRASTVKEDIVNDAYEGVLEDYASRLAISIHFNQKRLIEDGLEKEAEELARFINPHRSPYKKQLVAAVVHDAENWEDRFLCVLPERHGLSDNCEVLIIKVKELAEWRDEVYRSAINEVNP